MSAIDHPHASAPPDPRRWTALALLAIADVVVILDATIVNVALPSIGRTLHASTSELSWVVSAYDRSLGRRFPRRPPSRRPSQLRNPANHQLEEEAHMNTAKASTAIPVLTEIVLPGLVEPEGLVIHQRPVPTPGQGQALVEMLATGVSFAEQGMRRGRYPGQPKFPFVLGYDLVGVIAAVGPQVDESLVGRRVAAVVKTGGWTTHALVDAGHLVPVPDSLEAAEAETVVVNGVTAWQMLKKAKVHSGQTILVHGANGGVGNTLVQLARHRGIRVIGTASTRHHDALRAMGAEPVDYDDPELSDHVRLIAPSGVDAVFDHLGGPSFERSFKLLAPGGTLVAYGMAARRDEPGNMLITFLGMEGRLTMWSLAPNGRRALFYNFWAGKHIRPKRFWLRLASDLTSVFSLLAEGAITPHVAARMPLAEAGPAMTLAESRTAYGKVVLVP